MVLRLGQSLIGRQLVPVHRARQVLLNSVALFVQRCEAGFRLGIAAFGSECVPYAEE